MALINLITKLRRYQRRLNGCTIVYDCAGYHEMAAKIVSTGSEFERRSDHDLKSISRDLMARARAVHGLDDLLIEAYALVRETVLRILKIKPFDEQIIGGLVMHQGKIAEMQTGEGKTMTAVFPAYLNALGGKGVHVITFNDYLAKRDAEWMGPVYEFLGLSTGYVQEGMGTAMRKHAYNADITYVTAQEAGFDFLRDNLVFDGAHQVHRGFNYAIIDEADSILIDEARVPLVIAGILESADDSVAAAANQSSSPLSLARLVRTLENNREYEFDEYARSVFLTEKGIAHLENTLHCGNLYDSENGDILKQVHNALHAQYLLHRDKDYLVRNNTVELVDDFTGRVADRRRWPDGLHAAIEAKEQCEIKKTGSVLNSITLQYFLRHYPKLCGMTATAQIADEEFRAFYGLQIVVVPPHRKCIREDFPDFIYRTKAEKHKALVREIAAVHKTGRPILVGTQSVRESALLADALRQQEIECKVLNAKQDDYEAEIIAEAGGVRALTISTNMAGRGTDIRLGGTDEKSRAQVIALGGLYVIGTNRNESRRIDSQLRGRAGRQGDPGSSRFFVSLEDDLCIRYRLKDLIPQDVLSSSLAQRVDTPLVRSELDRLQRIIEGQNLEIKKTLCRYSAIIEQQRQHLFQRRFKLLMGTSIPDYFKSECRDHYDSLTKEICPEAMSDLCRRLALMHLDNSWSEYLAEIEAVREGIHLRTYGKQDPLFEFNKCAAQMFENLQHASTIRELEAFKNIVVKNGSPCSVDGALKAPSSTWTYLINDNPFDDAITGQLMGDTGFSLWAGLLWPLTMMHYWLKKKKIQNQNNLNFS